MTLPDDDLHLIKSGARRFMCNSCKTVSSPPNPNDDHGTSSAAASSLVPSSTPPHAAAAIQPVDLGAELVSLRALLMDALEGISFLSDQVAQLGEDNEQLRRESATKAEAHAVAVNSLRQEVHSLRSDLARLRGPPRLAHFPPLPTRQVAETKPAAPQTPGSSQNAALPLLSSSSPTLQANNEDGERVSSEAEGRTASAGLQEPGVASGMTGKTRRPARFGVGVTSELSVVAPRPRRKAMFVSKLSPDTTPAQLQEHFSSIGVQPLACRRLKTRYASYSSFHVALEDEAFQRLQDPNLWPKNCLFKPFEGTLHDHHLHTSETRQAVKDT